MIRLLRLSTGADGQSHVEEELVDVAPSGRDLVSEWSPAAAVRFEESPPGSTLAWHVAPHRQYVITLTGTLEFVTRDGERFRVGPGDVLLAEDTAGSGHQWQLEGSDPWRRMYVVLADGADVPFVAD